MGAVVLDSSVVIGFFDTVDAHHTLVLRVVASTRRAGGRFIVPATVLSESIVGQLRANPSAERTRLRQITGLFGPVRVVDEEVAVEAARLRAAHRGLRLPDALVIATGTVDDATVLTCDERWADVDGRVRVLARQSG